MSITTWNISGETSANNCSTNEIPSTSSSSQRYLTTAGMNQEKSNFASSPASEAREVNSNMRPAARSITASNPHFTAAEAPGSRINALSPSEPAMMK